MENQKLADIPARLRQIPMEARKLLCVIVRQIHHGALRSKTPGIATMPELHEACGLDVDHMYSVLKILRGAGMIAMDGQYPFEEIRLAGSEAESIYKRCEAEKMAVDDVLAELRFELLK